VKRRVLDAAARRLVARLVLVGIMGGGSTTSARRTSARSGLVLAVVKPS